jgi:hypothetical protein
MKNRYKAVLFLLALTTAVAFAPFLLRLEQVQSAVIGRLQEELPCEVRLDSVRWHWWPVPFVSLTDVHFLIPGWRLTAPVAEFHPSWLSLLRGQGSAGLIVLRQPHCRLEGPLAEEVANSRRFPQLALSVEDGTFSLASGILPPEIKAGLQVSGIHGRIKFSGEELKILASGTASFSREIKVDGDWRLPDNSHRLQVEVNGFKLHEIISSIAGLPVVPAESVVDLKGELRGRGLAELKAEIKGEFPCFLVQPQDRQLPVTCGLADLSLIKSDAGLELIVNNLEVKDPRISLSGLVLRNQPDIDHEPIWHIDLMARNLDIAQIRQNIQILLDPVPVVDKVVDVLRSGTAPIVRFQFSGSAAELAQFERLSIEGRLEEAAIRISEIDMHLEQVRGEFAIKEGKLHGHDLQAKLGRSNGWNGSLLLTLTGPFAIELDLDLEAELAELAEALHKTVRHDAFLREVDRFNGVQGRGSGHLHVHHDPLGSMVRVEVHDFAVSGRYERLPWPFAVTGGSLDIISDRQVSWQAIKGDIGPHRINETGGTVSWQDGLHLDMKSLRADLATKPFWRELIAYPHTPKNLLSALTFIDGTLEVTDGILHGPLRQPEQWQYQFNLRTDDLSWTSPLLSRKVKTRKASIAMDHREVHVIASENFIHDRSLLLQGRFRHRQLDRWHGWVGLNGTVDAMLSSWIKEKGWVPEAYYPRLPFTMSNLRIQWDAEHLSLNGGIAAGSLKDSLPRADFDIHKTGGEFTVKRLDITTAEEHAFLSLHLPGAANEGFQLDWRGTLQGNTLDALLEHNRYPLGRLAGVASFRYAPEDPLQTSMIGSLQMEDLHLPLSESGPLIIKRLQANGTGNRLAFPHLQMVFTGAEIGGEGSLATEEEALTLDFKLHSPALTRRTLSRLQSALLDGGGDKQEGGFRLPWQVLGHIGFDIAEFSHAGEESGPQSLNKKAFTYRWLPLQGSVDLLPGKSWSLRIDNARICGITMTGAMSTEDSAKNRIHLRSNPKLPPAFEEVMPCLGVDQDLVIGKFYLDATLIGQPGKWTGGEAKLSSERGNIRRLTLLSRVFKVVNLTDLFKNDGVPDMGGGGLPYSAMEIEAKVTDNQLVFEKAMVHGEGLNLFSRGRFDLGTFGTDLTILIAPLKTIDAIITKVPLIGRIIGGENATLVTIPVGVKGPISDPSVMVLSPEAIGEGFLLRAREILNLPFAILHPILAGESIVPAGTSPYDLSGTADGRKISEANREKLGTDGRHHDDPLEPAKGIDSLPLEESGDQGRRAQI